MPKLLGGVFPMDKITFLYGESGVGKTVSAIKALNESDVVPILIDYDHNLSPEVNGCKYIHIDGYAIKKTDNVIKNEVIIIDTYAKMDMKILKMLEPFNTIIIIGHNKGIATKTDIPDADEEFVNHVGSKLYLAYNKKYGTYNLTVFKCRGYSGDRIIADWMR